MAVCSACGTSYGPNVRICVHDGTPLTGAAKPDKYLGTLLESKYRIDAKVGSGGMGAVYRAEHVMLGKTVAVKVINHNLVTSDEVVVRFQREARAVASLDHPNIVTVYDLGQLPDGTLYIAMEYIDGPTLKSRIHASGPLAPEECVVLLRQVASGLSFAHRKHIVHRDLKSDNLMLTTDDGRTVVKLVDFGIAKTFDESTQLTGAGYMMGTPQYMSPEQAAGAPVDHRTDLYSLGVILYEALTGTVPFADATLSSVLLRLATEIPPPPSTYRSDGKLPPALDAVVMRCLEKDPNRRFQSADDFAAALDSACVDDGSRTALVPLPIEAAQTVVRPVTASQFTTGAAPRTSGPRPIEPAPVASSKLRVGVIALVVVVIGGAIAFSVNRLNRNDAEATPTRVADLNAPPPTANPRPDPAAGEIVNSGDRGPADQSPPAGKAFERAPTAAAPQPAAPEVSRVPRERVTPAPNPARIEAEPPVALTPPRTEPPKSDAGTGAAASALVPVPAAPAARAPSVAVVCEGPEVCKVVRAQLLQALRSNAFSEASAGAADVVVTAKITYVSQAPPTMQSGVMVTLFTYSVELSVSSRDKTVMHGPQFFEFEPIFSRARNVEAVAAEALEAVRSVAPPR